MRELVVAAMLLLCTGSAFALFPDGTFEAMPSPDPEPPKQLVVLGHYTYSLGRSALHVRSPTGTGLIPLSSYTSDTPIEVAYWEQKQALLVAVPDDHKILMYKMTPSGDWTLEPPTVLLVGGLGPDSRGTMQFDANGNLYVQVGAPGQSGNGTFAMITPGLVQFGGTSAQSPVPPKAGGAWTIPTPPGAAGPPNALNMTPGADGNIWFTETYPTDAAGHPIVSGQEKIGRITPQGAVTEFAVPTAFAGTGSSNLTTGTYITRGSDGNVWFTESIAGKVGRITPNGVITEFALGENGTILGLAAGPDGNIWVKSIGGTIYRVTPTGSMTSYKIPTVSFGSDVELVPGPDGALWFMEDTKIGRITTSGGITEYTLATPTVNGTPVYPFQLAFAPDGTGAFLEFTNSSVVTFALPLGALATTLVVEFYNSALDHYFISTNAQEISDLDLGVHVGWTRTSLAFNAYPPGHAGASPVCRFYIPPGLGDSHFFGRGSAECAATAQMHPQFDYESPEVMDMVLPNAGVCPAGTIPVYRVFSNRADANHRYTTVRAVRDQMAAKGWLVEGDGPDFVVMCSPQ